MNQKRTELKTWRDSLCSMRAYSHHISPLDARYHILLKLKNNRMGKFDGYTRALQINPRPMASLRVIWLRLV